MIAHNSLIMMRAADEKRILRELEQFTGSEHYYASTFGRLQLTDGAHYLRERHNCYWLIDIIESYQPRFADVPFQMWSIAVSDDKSAFVEMREDTGKPALVTQRVEYTDFPLSNFEMYCVESVVLLKSEY